MERAGDAVVLGGGIAGLLAARVLTDRFSRVTVIEQDRLPADGERAPEPRRGVPQGRHVHGLVIGGRLAVERLVPGFADALVARGAPAFDFAAELPILTPFGWGARFPSDLRAVTASRPLVEQVVRERVTALPGVTVRDGTRATGLVGDGAAIRAVTARDSSGATAEQRADLVVDASGRGSKLPAWLAALGCTPPPVRMVDSGTVYASRVYAIPPGHEADWRGCFVQLAFPRRARGGVLLPIEGDRWIVSLVGAGHDRPSGREEAFLPFARSLASPALADALAGAELLTPVARSASTANRRRLLPRAGRWPGNIVLAGDAACCFNPIYAQGMGAAAFTAELLGACLAETPALDRLGPRYHRRLARLAARGWLIATLADARAPARDGGPPSPTPAARIATRWLDAVVAAGTRDPAVQLTFLRVFHMLDAPASLLAPATVRRVVRPGVR